MFKKILTSSWIIGLMLVLGFPPAAAQESGTEIGVAPPGQSAIELIGQIDQQLFTVTAYGYVTWSNNFASDLLFVEGTNPLDRSETGARLTFMGTGTSTARSVHENIFASSVDATLTFYWNESPAGISWDDPNSFASGVAIATISTRLHSILNVQEPDVGVLMVTSDATWNSATGFFVNGQGYQLGHVGLVEHFTFFGQGYRSSTEPLAAQYRFAGNSVGVGGGS
jgi:hypothetical protein